LDIASRIQLEKDIDHIIVEGLTKILASQNSPKKNKSKAAANNLHKKQREIPETEQVVDGFLKQKVFYSFFPTVTLFLEQEPISNLAMNLDVNYRQVNQKNYNEIGETGKTLKELIFIQDDNSFQNSPIDLIFYKKKIQLENSQSCNYLANVASMSYCKLNSTMFKQHCDTDIDKSAYNLELLLCMKNLTAQFVTKKEYQKLLFILGFKNYNSNLICQNYEAILTLFKDFDTATEVNFKDMLKELQFPFIYNESTDIAENRQDFKDFFSCLTKIRCAVIEGAHRCESACRLLHGYQLGDPIPLVSKNIVLPSGCTLFKKVQTNVYYPKDDNMGFNKFVRTKLKGISKKISEQKNY